MKRILLLIFLLVNLQLTMQDGDLRVSLASISAQSYSYEDIDGGDLPEVVVISTQRYCQWGCGTYLYQSSMEEHEKNCEMRMVECPRCHRKDTKGNIDKGWHQCDGSSNEGGSGGGSGGGGGNNGSTSSSGHRTTIAKQDEAVKKAVEEMKQKYGKNVACNLGVQSVAMTIFGSVPSALKGCANDIYMNITKSSAWQQISAEQAGQYATDGYFVVGIWYGPTGNPPSDNGHVVLVRPTTNGKVEVMDTGYGNGNDSGTPGKRERQSINQSFRSTRRVQVKYYYYK